MSDAETPNGGALVCHARLPQPMQDSVRSPIQSSVGSWDFVEGLVAASCRPAKERAQHHSQAFPRGLDL